MYVHIKSEPNLWTVGHYDPSGKWHPRADYGNEDDGCNLQAFIDLVKTTGRLI